MALETAGARSLLVLAVDTSSHSASVALVRAGASPWKPQVLAETNAQISNAHGATLLPVVEDLLRRANIAIDAIDLFAVGVGPGSFTGTRVGVAMMKGFAVATGKPLIGIDAFAGLAAALVVDGIAVEGDRIRVAIDARKGEIYSADVVVEHDDVRLATAPVHVAPAALINDPGCAHVTGDGVSLVADFAHRPDLARPASTPLASIVGALAGARAPRNEVSFAQTDDLEPLYVRPPDITMPKLRATPLTGGPSK